MMPASNRAVGGDLAFPDVCKTPVGPVPVPIPYPNLALNVLALTFSPNVFWSFVPALNQISVIAMTTGDEPGLLGGLITGIIKGPGFVTLGNPVVFVNFVPAKNLLSMTSGNLFNAPLGFCLIPSITNVLLTCAGAAPALPPPPGYGVDVGRAVTAGMADALWGGEDRPERASASLLPDGLAWVRLAFFAKTAATDVWCALDRLGLGNVRAVLLDLRDNRGGDLRACIDLCDDFLPRGSVIARLDDGDGDETVHRARHDDAYPWPLAICVNRASASAAEICAGALQAQGRAVVVGEATAGKLSAQRLLGAPGADRYATLSEVRLAGGVSLRRVQPDVEARTQDDVELLSCARAALRARPLSAVD